jgi:glycosyltransferase involved in cell wall biosynthesis
MVGPDKGDGSLQIVKRMAAEMGVMDRVSLPGGVPKSEVPRWMNRNDIFLNTTHVDNRPISVLEAMACGLCIVSTNVGGIPSLLKHEQNALLVPPDDHEAMAAAIEQILTEPGLAGRLSQNARTDAERYDWSVVLPQWESLIMSLVKGRSW